MATTGVCDTFKADVMAGGHCFLVSQSSLAGAGVNAAFTITGLASTAGLAVGMAASGTNVAAGAIIASVDSATQVTVSKAHTGTVTTGTIGFTADAFKMLLIKSPSPTRTFDHTQTLIGTPGSGSPTTTNVGTDETSGTAYVSGGMALVNVSPSVPATPGTVGTISFSNATWTAATFATTAAIVWNTSLVRYGFPASGRAVSVHDFGGPQSVTSPGTFTVLMPTNDGNNALLRIA